nr:uncharacterized protein LOC121503229 [Drosophila kikkawai]
MAELLTSRADKWFQTSRLQGADWTTFRREFLEFFLPPRYLQRLDDRIRSREQLEGETFKDFMLDLRVLMRHAGYDETQELNRLYENVAPEYQMYIRRSEFQTIGELAQLATEFEAVQKRSRERQHGNPIAMNTPVRNPLPPRQIRPPSPMRPSQGNTPHTQPEPRAPEPARVNRVTASDRRIDVRDACRNCGEPGHFSRDCRNARQYFSWDCGRRDVRTVECCRRQPQGNGVGPLDRRSPSGPNSGSQQ